MGWGTAEKFYSYQRKCQAWVGWEQTANTDTQATIKVTGCARSGDGSGYYYAYDFGVTVKIFYRVDGGSWHELKATTAVLNYGAEVGTISASFTINRTHAKQVVEVATDAISTTNDWDTATAKMTINVNAKTSYLITLNANKPSAAAGSVTNMPANQTKWYNESLTLPSTSPTLTLYNFMGWNTKADGTGTTYAAGGTYPASSNAAATLYAQWELAYAYPSIDPATVIRCDSSGSATEDGTYGKVTFTWSIDTTADGGANAGKRAVISWKPTTTSSWDNASSTTVTLSGTGGTVNRVFGTIATDTSYDVRIAVTDTHTIDSNECTAYRYLTLSQAYFTMDFLAGGHGVAMGTAATQTDAFELAMDFDHSGGVTLDATAKAAWQTAIFGAADTEWAYLVGSASGNFCRWRVKSGWVQVEVYYSGSAGLSANTAKRQGTGTIPAAYRPDHEVNNALYLGANKNGQADMWVAKGGDVWVNSTIASTTVYGQLQYPL